MSIQIFTNYLGGYVYCDCCKNPLTLSSKTDYSQCDECGWPIDIKTKPKMQNFQTFITNLYENNPVAFFLMTWTLGAVTSAMITYLMMR